PGVPPRNVPVGQPLTVPFGFAVTPPSVPVTAALCETVCAGIAARYPAVRPGSAGRSALGRRLSLLSLGTGPARVFFNAVHHANEWITAWLVLTFFEEYARAAALGLPFAGQSAAALAARTTLTVLPLVDPDGADLVTGALSDGPAFDAARAAAEAYPAIPFPDGWKANALGTDLNLNYPAGWETARDIKFAEGFVSPAPRDFVGEAPLSAPESRAVAALSRGADFSLSVSFHTQGEVIYWRYGGREPAGSARIARRLAEVSGYALDDAPYRSSFAGYKDWFIETFDRPGFTVEAGLGRNPLPLSDFPGLYARVKPLMLAALNEA
ncbi:MAG: M14 family metallocarboxypeptidase, partial [Oscillospiraceae bacterium]|nr:M14 family metallocarboxypeptidase [Oscillospiraceae bacterium]